MSNGEIDAIQHDHLIISCEGAAEEVIANKLINADKLVFPRENVIDVTRLRKATDLQNEYLNFDYNRPVCIMRIVDSRTPNFVLGSLCRDSDRYRVTNVITHPEIEVLAIIREGAWSGWRKSGKKPSVFCKDDLRMTAIKSAGFLEDYWDATSIAEAARKYRRLAKIPKRELCLADILAGRKP